jgi:hypothetical protein
VSVRVFAIQTFRSCMLGAQAMARPACAAGCQQQECSLTEFEGMTSNLIRDTCLSQLQNEKGKVLVHACKAGVKATILVSSNVNGWGVK